MFLTELIDSLKKDWQTVKADISVGAKMYEEIKAANAGVTDPAEWVTNAAKAIVTNESQLPESWRGTNLEKAVIKFCTKLETGVVESEVETIVKEVIAAVAVAK